MLLDRNTETSVSWVASHWWHNVFNAVHTPWFTEWPAWWWQQQSVEWRVKWRSHTEEEEGEAVYAEVQNESRGGHQWSQGVNALGVTMDPNPDRREDNNKEERSLQERGRETKTWAERNNSKLDWILEKSSFLQLFKHRSNILSLWLWYKWLVVKCL